MALADEPLAHLATGAGLLTKVITMGKGYKLSKVSGWALIIYMVALVPMALRAGGGTAGYNTGFAVGSIFGSLVFATLLSFVGWRLAGRSQTVATIVFCLVLLLGGVNGFVRLRLVSQNTSLQSVCREVDKRMKEAAKEIRKGGVTSPKTLEHLLKVADDLEKIAQTASKEDAAVLRANASVIRGSNALAIPYQRESVEFLEAGGFDPASWKTVADLDAGLDRLLSLKKMNADLMEYYDKLPAAFEGMLTQAGLRPDVVARHASEFIATENIHGIRRLRRAENEIYVALESMGALLRRHFGQWSPEPSTGLVLFSGSVPGTEVAEYTQIITKIGTLSETFEKEQERILTEAGH